MLVNLKAYRSSISPYKRVLQQNYAILCSWPWRGLSPSPQRPISLKPQRSSTCRKSEPGPSWGWVSSHHTCSSTAVHCIVTVYSGGYLLLICLPTWTLTVLEDENGLWFTFAFRTFTTVLGTWEVFNTDKYFLYDWSMGTLTLNIEFNGLEN